MSDEPKKQGTSLDFQQSAKILNAMIHPVSVDPVTPVTSQLWYNTTSNRFKSYDGSNVFTLLTVQGDDTITGIFTFNPASGSVPFVVDASKSEIVTNLNAHKVGGYPAAEAATESTVAARKSDGTLTVASPVADTDAATKAYVDAAITNQDIKDEVRVATTGNIDLSSMPATIDGVSLNANERLLAKNQTDPSENGIYTFPGSGSAATRAADADESAEVTTGMTVFVVEGSTHAGAIYTLTTPGTINLGTTNLTFTQTGGQSVFGQGNGIVKADSKFHFIQSTNYTVGSIAYADSATTMAFLSPAGSGTVLKGGATPSWAAIDLTADVGASILPVANGGTGVSTQFTQGSLIFAGASGVYSQDSANLFWDDTNNRLGVGTNTPGYLGHFKAGDSSTTADAAANTLVVEGAAAAGFSVLTGSGGVSAIMLGGDGTPEGFSISYEDTNSKTLFRRGATQVFHITGTGNINIDTAIAAPAYHDRVGDSNHFLDLHKVETLATLAVLSSGSSMAFLIDASDTSTAEKWYWMINSTDADNATTVMSLNEAGQLAIGDGTPSEALHVLSGNARVDGLFRMTSLWNCKVFDLANPGSDTGAGYWYIRIHADNLSANDVSLRVTVTGGWSHSPIFGFHEAEYAYHSDANGLSSSNYYRVTKNFGTGNLRLEPLVEENGFISIPVWASNANQVRVIVQYLDEADQVDLTPTSFTAGTLPSMRPETAVGGFNVQSGDFTVSAGKLHVTSGSSGGAVPSNRGDNLVAESDGDVGISLICPADSAASINLGDPDNNETFRIAYDHDDDSLSITSAGIGHRIFISGTGNIGFGTNSPAAGFHHASGNAKFDAAVTVGGNLTLTALTANKAVFIDASKNLTTTGTTDLIAEGATNVYYTDARARGALSTEDAAEIAYNPSTGAIGLGTQAGRIVSGTIGDGTTTDIVYTHNFGTRAVGVQVVRNASPYDEIDVQVLRTDDNSVTAKFITAPGTDALLIICWAANG